jgi:hypothetical protein
MEAELHTADDSKEISKLSVAIATSISQQASTVDIDMETARLLSLVDNANKSKISSLPPEVDGHISFINTMFDNDRDDCNSGAPTAGDYIVFYRYLR